jgi:hypothetical protein
MLPIRERLADRVRVQVLIVIGLLATLAAGCAELATIVEPAPRGVLPPPTPVPALEDRTECAEIYGTAFRSHTEQAWYSETCSEWPLVIVEQTPLRSGSESAVAHRTDCDQIRGTTYRSVAERAWYFEHCLGQRFAVPLDGDRTDCGQIRGTQYRSSNERGWYLQNCLGGAGRSDLTDRTSCAQIQGTEYRSEDERAWFRANC